MTDHSIRFFGGPWDKQVTVLRQSPPKIWKPHVPQPISWKDSDPLIQNRNRIQLDAQLSVYEQVVYEVRHEKHYYIYEYSKDLTFDFIAEVISGEQTR